MAPLRWGIMSAGLISWDFVLATEALSKEDHLVVAVGARSLESAKSFAKIHSIPKAYGSYMELVQDPEVDVVYVGSINTQHLSLVKLALNNGKHVLCEKPLGMNAKETKEMLDLAKTKKLFLMEAIWTRFFPVYQELRKRIDDGSLGDILQVLVTFGINIKGHDRLACKELGGGTILDLGLYCIQFAEFVFAEKPLKVITGGQLNAYGIDESSSTTLVFSKGRTATLVAHFRVDLPNEAFVFGTRKTLKVRAPFWCPTELEEVGGQVLTFPLPKERLPTKFINGIGMNFECQEVRNCILRGALESVIVSHHHTLIIAETMESMRKQVGVTYSQDE